MSAIHRAGRTLGVLSAFVMLGSIVLSAPARADLAADAAELRSCMADAEAAAGPVADCEGRLADPCLADPAAVTTVAMVGCIERERAAWDTILNEDYEALIGGLEPDAATATRDVQRTWIAFRDADCNLQRVLIGGTLAEVTTAACLAHRTAQRVFDFRALLMVPG